MIVFAGQDASVSFDSTTAKEYRIADENGVIQDWTPTSSPDITIPASMNTLAVGQPLRRIVVSFNDGSLISYQVYTVADQNPLVIMINSFSSVEEAMSIAASNMDMVSALGMGMEDFVNSMSGAFDALVNMNYYLSRDYDDCDKNRASYTLPDYDQGGIIDFRDYDADDFSQLDPSFIRAMKRAQIYAAIDAINRREAEGLDNPRLEDPDLITRKIGDTSETWRAKRTVVPRLGTRAMREIAGYVWTPLRTTRI